MPREPSAGLAVGAIPREPPGFQPRADLLAELDEAAAGPLAPCPVTGVPGAGTTQLAAAYARAALARGSRLVAWVSARDRESLLGGLATVADAAGLPGGGAGTVSADRGQLVRRWLETDGERCLLVFDDVCDPEAVRPFLPAGGAARVIVTSHRGPDLGTSVKVEAFSDEEALALLAGRAGLADAAAAGPVAAELGHLPLALAPAAAVLAGRHLEPGTYLDELRAVPAAPHLPGDSLPGEAEYPPAAAQAVRLALDAARSADPAGLCAAAMDVISVLSGAGVRRDLLHLAGQLGALGGRRVAAGQVDDALEQAAGWSLLTFSLDGQVILVSRLVTQVIREQLAGQRRLAPACRAVAAVLGARAEAVAGSPDRLAVRDVPEQVMALAKAARPVSGSDEALTRVLLRRRFLALYHLIELGDSADQAIAAGEPLTADLERMLGPDHHDTLNARNSLAAAYQAAGRPADAIALFEQTLVIRERLGGPEHPDTLTTQNNLAFGYQAAGRAGEARHLFELTLAARERLLGPGHPSTMAARNNLAAAYRQAGRVLEAIPLFERTLADCERLFGADHPRTLRVRKGLVRARESADRAGPG